MKKMVSLLAVLALLAIQVPVIANAESITPSDNYKVSVMNDTKINKKTVGTVVAVLGNIDVQNDVVGDIICVFGNVTVNARVSGQVVAVLGNVKLTDKAEIGRDVISIGSIEKAEGAKVSGNETSIDLGQFNINKINIRFIIMLKVILNIICTVFIIGLGLLLLTIFKEKFKNISAGIENRTGRKLVIGFLGLLGMTITFLVLFITLLVPVLCFIAMLVVDVVVGIYFGRVLLNTFDAKLNIYMEFIIGFLLIAVVEIILLLLAPQVGLVLCGILYFIFGLLVKSLGIGILIESKFGSAIKTAT